MDDNDNGSMDAGNNDGGALGQGSPESPSPENNGGAGDGLTPDGGQQSSVVVGANGQSGTATDIIDAHEMTMLTSMGIDAARVTDAVAAMGADKAKAWLGGLVQQQYQKFAGLQPEQQPGGQQQPQQQQPGQQGQQQRQGQQWQNGAPVNAQGAPQVDTDAVLANLADDKLQPLVDAYGTELVDGVVKPLRDALADMRQQLQQVTSYTQSAQLEEGRRNYQAALTPLLATDELKAKYGADWTGANKSQVDARQQLARQAQGIMAYHRQNGQEISPAEALKIAFSVAHLKDRQQSAQDALRNQVVKNQGRQSIPPSMGRSTGMPGKSNPTNEYAAAEAEINRIWDGGGTR